MQEEQQNIVAPREKWTIMIYLAGNNSLSSMSVSIMQHLEDVLANIRDYEMIDADKFVRVLACFDANTPVQKGTRYLEINHRRKTVNNGMNWGLHNDMVPPEERDEPNIKLGLERFLKFATTKHRADKYMLIFFGHGMAVAGNTFLLDENPYSFLKLTELQSVLAKYFGDKGKTGKKLEILAFNNCVMNGAEIIYELRNEAKYTIGSQGLILQVGWPYGKLIKSIVKNIRANKPTIKIAEGFLKVCARNLLDYTLMDSSSEQAVCDLQNQDSLIKTLSDNLVPALNRGLRFDEKSGNLLFPSVREAIRLAHLEAQSYWDETFTDLADFCDLLIDKCNIFLKNFDRAKDEVIQTDHKETNEESENADEKIEPVLSDAQNNEKRALREIKDACGELLTAIEKVVKASFYIGPALQYSHGISVYFPWTSPMEPIFFDESTNPPMMKTPFDEYKSYSFAKDTRWGSFLETYFKATLRNVRREEISFREIILDVNLSKSNSTISTEDGSCVCPSVKNYPRRFYLSPYDESLMRKGKMSYLGWVPSDFIERLISPPSYPLQDELEEGISSE